VEEDWSEILDHKDRKGGGTMETNSPETISNRNYNRNTNTNTDSDDHLIRYASSASVDDVVWCGSSG